MTGYAVRISRSATECNEVCRRWKLYCDTIVMYEHGENANRVHCHLYLGGVSVTTKRLKQLTGWPNLGNTLWSFQKAQDEVDVYITYMSKGKYDPEFLHGYELKDADRLRQLWIEPAPKIPPALKAYKDFEAYVLALEPELRMYSEDITRLATGYVKRRDGMFTMVNQNHIRNYMLSYVYDHKLRSRPQL